MEDLRKRLSIDPKRVAEVNEMLLDPGNEAVSALLDVVAWYGAPEEINEKARQAGRLDNLLKRLKETGSPYLQDVEWLIAQRDSGAFVTVREYRRKVLGDRADTMVFAEDSPVVLEISAAQYFPWLRAEAEKAIADRELMPGRFIRVRNMKEQENDNGDILAFAAAMNVMGASYVNTLDTRGTDGSNVHLGGPATITGYFGGIGQPNDYPLKWADELLYYYTNYGINEVLNTNAGTVMAAYMLHRLGIDIKFKISVFMGTDNPFSALWTLIGAKMFSRPDGATSLAGFNLSNSVNNATIEAAGRLRKALGFENEIRLEHHITEAWKSIVRQPYDRRQELMEIAGRVKNIGAKHEGGDVEVEQALEASGGHPSDIFDYFRKKDEVMASGDWEVLFRNYIDKHNALNRTARELTERGYAFVAAPKLHHR